MENKNIVMRIKMLIENKKVSPSKFAKMIGFNQSNLSKVLRGDREVPTNLINAICNSLDIPYTWIVNGEGSMFLTDSENNTQVVTDTQAVDNTPTISYSKGKPYYDVDFLGGFDMVFNDQTINPEYLIDFKKYEDADCWCNVSGHSMEPLISNGDIIAIKRLYDWQEFLLYGEVYGIITNDMRTVKIVTKSDKGDDYIHLVPVNKSEEYQPQDLPKKLITHVFRVLGCTKKL